MKKELESRKQFMVRQVEANLAIEDMHVDRNTHETLLNIAKGEETAEQAIHEIVKEYANG